MEEANLFFSFTSKPFSSGSSEVNAVSTKPILLGTSRTKNITEEHEYSGERERE